MRPKFSVGEVVILQSVNYPEFNDEYIVHAVLDGEDTYMCRASGHMFSSWVGDSMYVYVLDGPIVYDGKEILWSEKALRKKQEPCGLSYEELMASMVTQKLLEYKPEGVAPL
jgi:hypothetical protein